MKKKILGLPVQLFHVTTANRADDIRKQGLLTRVSRSKQKVIWFVTREKLNWGLLHTAQRHDSFKLIILTCLVYEPIRTSWQGVLISREDIPPSDIKEYMTVQYSDDPDFVPIFENPDDISRVDYGIPCPFCQARTLAVAFDKDGDISYCKCPSCKQEPPDQPQSFEE